MFAITRINSETGAVQYVGNQSSLRRIFWKNSELDAKFWFSHDAAEKSGMFLGGLLPSVQVKQLT